MKFKFDVNYSFDILYICRKFDAQCGLDFNAHANQLFISLARLLSFHQQPTNCRMVLSAVGHVPIGFKWIRRLVWMLSEHNTYCPQIHCVQIRKKDNSVFFTVQKGHFSPPSVPSGVAERGTRKSLSTKLDHQYSHLSSLAWLHSSLREV